jgi:hypothetical protein
MLARFTGPQPSRKKMLISLSRRTGIVAALVAALAAPAAAGAAVKDTLIQSPVGGSPPADAASDNTTFSQDGRTVGYMAFDSAASNLTPGDTNGKRDVFVVKRAGGEGNLQGTLTNVSEKLASDSTKPSLSGENDTAAKCVVFQSGGDVYMASVSGKGRPDKLTRGTSPKVDGTCEFVVFQRGGTIMLWDENSGKNGAACTVANGANPDIQTNGKGAAYESGRSIKYQAWTPTGCDGGKLDRDGREITVDVPKSGRPGGGDSANPALDDNGYYVAFESTRTNLCEDSCQGSGGAEDKNGAISDIFRRTLNKDKAPWPEHMQRARDSGGSKGLGTPCVVDAYANGPSSNPAISGAGEYVVFDSAATNLRESLAIESIDPNGPARDVFLWNGPRERRAGNVSRERRSADPSRAQHFFNGPTTKPSISSRGNYMGFTGDWVSGGSPAKPGAGVSPSCRGGGCALPNVFMRFGGGSDEGFATN